MLVLLFSFWRGLFTLGSTSTPIMGTLAANTATLGAALTPASCPIY